MEEKMVCIPVSRFEQLLRLETRVRVASEIAMRRTFIEAEEVLAILGTADTLKASAKLRKEIEDINKRWGDSDESRSEEDL